MSTPQAPLTPLAISSALQAVTLAALGLPANAYDQVRIAWQTTAQPREPVTQDVCYIAAIEDEDLYNKVRDVTLTQATTTTDTITTTYTRVWRVMWTFYGPNSFDRARQMRSALLTQATHDQLAGSQLFLVTAMTAPLRAPERYAELWRERVDFHVQMNEFVTEVSIVQTVASVDVSVEVQQ